MAGQQDNQGKWEYLPHTADALFRAYGKTLEEAFTHAALAMANLTFDSNTIKPAQQQEITLEADSLRELLLCFLDEFVFLQDTEGFLLHEVTSITIKKGMPWKLHALVTGDHYKAYEMHGQLVKAATYNDMLIEQQDEEYMLQVVVDI